MKEKFISDMRELTNEELHKQFKDKTYKYLNELLHKSKLARESNEFAIMTFYKDLYGYTTFEQVFRDKNVLRIESVSRKIRLVKAQDHSIPKVDKSKAEDEYKEMSKDITFAPISKPLQTQLF